MKRSKQLWTSSVMLLVLNMSATIGAPPAWWTTRNVLVPENPTDDYAVINQGQLKNLAYEAYLEMQGKLPDGAGSVLTFLVTPWLTPSASTDDFSAVSVGQLKQLAKPFYDRLIEAGLASAYPWTTTIDDDDNYALANIGMTKKLFSFALPAEAPVVLNIFNGNNQSTLRGTILANPLTVRTTQGGVPKEGVEVHYQCITGSLAPSTAGIWSPADSGLTAITDAEGYASVHFKTPNLVTANSVVATLITGQEVAFAFHASPGEDGQGGEEEEEVDDSDPNDPTFSLALNLIVTTPNR